MPRNPDRLIVRLGIGLATGVVVGLVCGVLARILMRVVAVTAGSAGEFSWGGTVFIVGLFVVVCIPGSVLAAAYRGRGRSLLLVAASLFLCVPATSVAREDLSSIIYLTTLEWIAVSIGTAAIYVVILAMPVVVLRLLRAWGAGAQSSWTRPRSVLVSPR